jgi:hypothetical protein
MDDDDDWLMDEEGGTDPDADKGPWVTATFDSECSCGLHLIFEGDRIRADGYGEWEKEECNQ